MSLIILSPAMGGGALPPVAAAGSNDARIDAFLDNYTVPFAGLTYPADPVTTREVSVSTAADFNTEAAVAGTKINITSSFTGNVSITADDIDVVMDNAYTISGQLNIPYDFGAAQQRRRIRWTGGNILTVDEQSTWRSVEDVLFQDVHVRTMLVLHREGNRPNKRIAFLDFTIDTRNFTDNTLDHSLFVQQDAAMDHHEDFIFANYRGEPHSNTAFRVQQVERGVAVESAFNMFAGSDNGMRWSVGCNNIFISGRAAKPILTRGRNFLNFNDFATASITNSTWDHIRQWRTFNQAFLHSGLPNTGTVSNYELFTPDGSAGESISISPFTDGGNISAVQAWDGTVAGMDDASSYGAQR